MKQLVVKSGQRYNPSALWREVNPVLMAGEIGIESDTGLFKFGDGKTPWNNLRYAGGGGSGGQVDTTLTQAGQAADAKAITASSTLLKKNPRKRLRKKNSPIVGLNIFLLVFLNSYLIYSKNNKNWERFYILSFSYRLLIK